MFQKLFRIQILKLLKRQENVPGNIPGYERPIMNGKRKKNIIIRSVNKNRHDSENSNTDDDEEDDREKDKEIGKERIRGRERERIREKMKVNKSDSDTRIAVHQGDLEINKGGGTLLISLMKPSADSIISQC